MPGSSPRLRGTDYSKGARLSIDRFIPAPAGNGCALTRRIGLSPVHPRACGERCHQVGSSVFHPGSSPRLRGTGLTLSRVSLPVRFIPAPAGNGLPTWCMTAACTVHPRACGERIASDVMWFGWYGSSPRLRGTASHRGFSRPLRRFIPAPAGNGRARKKPRLCSFGSSPRLRGTVHRKPVLEVAARFIPAPAGNGARQFMNSLEDSVHPRACGERGPRPMPRTSSRGSSPRLRGTAVQSCGIIRCGRFIPAPAGNGFLMTAATVLRTVHPRACGERSRRRCAQAVFSGSSPRLRGTAARPNGNRKYRRFIPAPAGNGDATRAAVSS